MNSLLSILIAVISEVSLYGWLSMEITLHSISFNILRNIFNAFHGKCASYFAPVNIVSFSVCLIGIQGHMLI